MRQARVLTDPELKRLLAVVAQRTHAERNRMVLFIFHLAGLASGKSPADPAGPVRGRRRHARPSGRPSCRTD